MNIKTTTECEGGALCAEENCLNHEAITTSDPKDPEKIEEKANFLQVGRATECSKCHPEKEYLDCDLIFKQYGIKCKCICHEQPMQNPDESMQEDKPSQDWEVQLKTLPSDEGGLLKTYMTQSLKRKKNYNWIFSSEKKTIPTPTKNFISPFLLY